MVTTKKTIPKRTLAGRPPVCSQRRDAYSTTFFPSGEIEQVAKASGLIERQRKLTGEMLATTLAFWSGDAIGYSDIAAEISIASKKTSMCKTKGRFKFTSLARPSSPVINRSKAF